MTLEDLRVFVAACEAGSLSAVARAAGCTQPAVAQHLARLERELASPLLERTSRGVVVTPAGRILYEAASTSLGALALALREIERERRGEAGRLAIATGGTTVRHVMSEAVTELRRRHPEVALHFEPANSTPQCMDLLTRRAADLAFVTIGEEAAGFEQRAALELALVLLVRADHAFASRRRLRIRDLVGIRWIALSQSTLSQRLTAPRFAEQGVTLFPALRVDDHDTAHVFIELGLGQAIMPCLHAAHFAPGGRVRAIPIADLPPVQVGWAARSFRLLPPVAHEFMTLVSQAAGAWHIRGVRVLAESFRGKPGAARITPTPT